MPVRRGGKGAGEQGRKGAEVSADWKSPSETEKRLQPLTSQPLRGLVTFSRGFQSLGTMADDKPNDPPSSENLAGLR